MTVIDPKLTIYKETDRYLILRLDVPARFTKQNGDKVFTELRQRLDEAKAARRFVFLVSGEWKNLWGIGIPYLRQAGKGIFDHDALTFIYPLGLNQLFRMLGGSVAQMFGLRIKMDYTDFDSALAAAENEAEQYILSH